MFNCKNKASQLEVVSAEEISEMKNRLSDYRLLNRDIENSIERLQKIEDKLYGVSSSKITDMPRMNSPIADKNAYLICIKDELESKIKEDMSKRDEERSSLVELILALRKPDERAVIMMRYIDCVEWDWVIDALYSCKDDYEVNYDNYKQRTFRLHSSAILKMAQASYQKSHTD